MTNSTFFTATESAAVLINKWFRIRSVPFTEVTTLTNGPFD